jgi:branched-chain amino acid transport system permease protein
MTWVNVIVQGILLGGFYALLACGLSLMFGVMRVINLAHGDVAVLGAFMVWEISKTFHVSPFVAAVPALGLMLTVGYLFYYALLKRSVRAGPLVPLLTTFGVAIVIQNGLLQAFSPDVHSLGSAAGRIATGSWRLHSQLRISWLGLLTLAVAVTVLGGLQLFLQRTGPGREMRATAQDADTAQLVGINAHAVYARATSLALATAAIAGTFLVIRSTVDPFSGSNQLIFAFEAVVIGGLGTLWGTLWGGVVLGVAQAVGAQIHPQYSILAGHLVFLFVLATPQVRARVFRRSSA